MTHFFAYIQILRPLNLILCIISVLVSAWLINAFTSSLLPYTIIVVFCFTGAANILNDVLDVHIDIINKPKRILPSGYLSIRNSVIFMGLLFLIGILASTQINLLGRQIALILVLPMLVLYTPLFKRLPLIGNLIVGIILGLVFLFTEGSIYGEINIMWTPFILATILSTIRELCKDAEDVRGDLNANFQTFPLKYGFIYTLWVIRILSVGLCVYSIIPWIVGQYGLAYLFSLIICVETPLLYGVFCIIKMNSHPEDYSQVARLMKIVTLMGIIVIFLSGF